MALPYLPGTFTSTPLVDQMRYYDIYPPLVALDKTFDIETSKATTLEAMQVLGDDWVEMQSAAMDERWVHVYPQRGKRSGAYMNPGAFDVHPLSGNNPGRRKILSIP